LPQCPQRRYATQEMPVVPGRPECRPSVRAGRAATVATRMQNKRSAFILLSPIKAVHGYGFSTSSGRYWLRNSSGSDRFKYISYRQIAQAMKTPSRLLVHAVAHNGQRAAFASHSHFLQCPVTAESACDVTGLDLVKIEGTF
jgi:hypothetical protein